MSHTWLFSSLHIYINAHLSVQTCNPFIPIIAPKDQNIPMWILLQIRACKHLEGFFPILTIFLKNKTPRASSKYQFCLHVLFLNHINLNRSAKIVPKYINGESPDSSGMKFSIRDLRSSSQNESFQNSLRFFETRIAGAQSSIHDFDAKTKLTSPHGLAEKFQTPEA